MFMKKKISLSKTGDKLACTIEKQFQIFKHFKVMPDPLFMEHAAWLLGRPDLEIRRTYWVHLCPGCRPWTIRNVMTGFAQCALIDFEMF